MVDRRLDDGRLVVVNDSRVNIPVGTVFTSLFVEKGETRNEEWHVEQVGPTRGIALTLERVEWFRRDVDSIPFGHNAAVLLAGEGLPALEEAMARTSPGFYVFIGAD